MFRRASTRKKARSGVPNPVLPAHQHAAAKKKTFGPTRIPDCPGGSGPCWDPAPGGGTIFKQKRLNNDSKQDLTRGGAAAKCRKASENASRKSADKAAKTLRLLFLETAEPLKFQNARAASSDRKITEQVSRN